ncbi:MAG: hypothetical protein KIT68_09725 [Phycisphaeraceae bacterium]|nr:hypothetical protein [Phycisphaeraceae bacterium]
MNRTRVYIEVSPSRLEAAVVRAGREVLRERLRAEQADWGAPWPDCLESLAPVLRGWVERAGAAGAPATVFYDGPTATGGVYSCPAAVGPANAERAAVLALREAASFDVQANPRDCAVIRRDGTGGARRLHALAVSDAAASVGAVEAFVTSAGLRCERLMPAEGVVLWRSVAAATGGGAGARLVLWMGEHWSVLAAGSGGRLVFVRRLGVGVEGLVDAMCRPLRPQGGGGPVNLPRGEARRLLTEVGVPGPEIVVDCERGLTGASVLPVLQPVLQRLGVELKQSMRFGLAEAERASAVIGVIGPGGSVRRLAAALAGQCGASAVESPAGGGRAEDRGVLDSAARGGAPDLDLASGDAAGARALSRARRSLWSGIAAAGVAVAGLGVWAHVSLAGADVELAALRAEATQSDADVAEAQRASAEVGKMLEARARIARSLGDAPPWAEALAVLSERVPAEIRLSSVTAEHAEGPARVRIVGVMAGAEDRAFAAAMRRLADDLAGCPLVAGVTMGATSRVRVNEAEGHRFEMTLTLVGLPARAADLARSEGTP